MCAIRIKSATHPPKEEERRHFFPSQCVCFSFSSSTVSICVNGAKRERVESLTRELNVCAYGFKKNRENLRLHFIGFVAFETVNSSEDVNFHLRVKEWQHTFPHRAQGTREVSSCVDVRTLMLIIIINPIQCAQGGKNTGGEGERLAGWLADWNGNPTTEIPQRTITLGS